jgi:hypothetical protein
MSYAETESQTYTIADIGKVIDCFAADLDMNAQSTDLLTRDRANDIAADVKAMAQSGYLREANIVLHDSTGRPIRAAKYEVVTGTLALAAQRPGNNLWPRTPGGFLTVVVRYAQLWSDLAEAKKQQFRARLRIGWTSSATDLSFPTLTRSSDRSYSSNGWGVTKSLYT